LATAAAANGIAVTDILPHGCDPMPSGPHTGPFVFLGTLAWHKGPDLVRRAWERAATGIPLRLHGRPGPDPSFRVHHDGPLDDIGVAEVLAGARALVLGSRWPENAPLVVLEARAAGCPVIAPAIGGLPELVEHGVDGWLYPPGDEQALAACLVAAAATSVRPRPPPTFQTHVDGLLEVYASARRSRRSHE
jgi:glycosyltransferase involved in cell wall biosynthesis